MSWYIHPTKQLRDDELPPELVVTNRDGSIEQVYVPYNASDLEAENEKLRELVKALNWCIDNGSNELGCNGCPLTQSSWKECECEIRMRELGVRA